MKLIVKKSHLPQKKYDAIFEDDGKKKVVSFGATGYDDYVLTGNKMKRDRYIKRHGHHEDFNDKFSKGALSRWILWGNSTSIKQNIADYKKRFNLQ
jgi:hypothetical protein